MRVFLAIVLASVLTAGVALAAPTAAQLSRATRLLELLRLVDGPGSGLDADTVRGRTADDTSTPGVTPDDVHALAAQNRRLEERLSALESRLQQALVASRQARSTPLAALATRVGALEGRLTAVQANMVVSNAAAHEETTAAVARLDQRLVALEERGEAGETTGSETTGLEVRVERLEKLLASASLVHGGQTLRFSGVNVQIVSGSGATLAPLNGLGNLIVGYNESRGGCGVSSGPTCDYPVGGNCGANDELSCVDQRTGSHNIVVGIGNNYVGSAGLVVGQENSIGRSCSAVLGGFDNYATGWGAVVVGGVKDQAIGEFSLIAGGWDNYAPGQFSFIGGGRLNDVRGDASSAFGGYQNYVTGKHAVVSGGIENQASGEDSTVSGGRGRQATGTSDWVAGPSVQDE